MNEEDYRKIRDAADVLGEVGYEILAEQVRAAYETIMEKLRKEAEEKEEALAEEDYGEFYSNCLVCYEPHDYCQGHGEIG